MVIFNFFKKLYRCFNDENCTYRAAALTYTTLLSLVPLIAVSFTIFSYLPTYQTAAMHVQDFIFKHFVASSGEVIQNYLQTFVERATHVSIVGFISLLITAALMVYNIEVAFNGIWKVKRSRRLATRVVIYIGVLILAPLLLVTSVIVSNYFNLPALTGMPFLFSVLTFTFIYKIIPNCAVPLKNAFIAAISISLLFELSKKGFNIYLHYFASYDLFYGALSAIPILLLWIYIVWIIILLGVVVSHVLTTNHPSQVLH